MSISVEELEKLIRGRIGLIIGPAFTHRLGILTGLSENLSNHFRVEQGVTYQRTGELAIQAGHNLDTIKSVVADFFSKEKPSVLLGQLSKVRWSAIFSASHDLAFEDRLRQEYDRCPLRHEITVASDLTQSIPPRSIPVFKLLGSLDRGDFVCSDVEYLQKRATWRNAVKLFVDFVRDAPVLCLGMSECEWVFNDLIVEMLGNPIGLAKNFVILSSDPIAANQSLQRLVENRITLVPVNASLGQLLSAIENIQISGPSQPPASDTGFESLAQYTSLAAIVNCHLTTDVKQQEHQRLLDLLFSPAVSRWDPYVYSMDFHRTAANAFVSGIENYLSTSHPDASFAAAILTGSVASGKTVLLKRVAFDLAEKGHLVLWLKPSYFQDTHSDLQELFRSISRIKSQQGHPVVVFMDDPLGFGNITPKRIISTAQSTGVNVLLCVAVRSSEWATRNPDDIFAALPVASQLDLPEVLDEIEWAALPSYLVDLGVEPNLESAQQQVSIIESRTARDTLSMLYWLLPGTKPIISSAIRDELFRLGDTAGLTRVLVGASQHTTQMLKDAYEMVAVSDSLGAPLPMEVLVSALEVPYSDWIEAVSSRGPAWGFLYSEESEDEATIVYRPRNAIVTDVIINAINGGSFSHSGQTRVMKKLLSACTGSQLIYRNYCAQVLVNSSVLERFEYDEGLSLYNAAIDSLPYLDRTLIHHKGLWVKNKGHDPLRADKILRQALETKKYPYVTQDEADEHIYTSLAATTLDAIDQGQLTLEEGKSIVLEHLAKAKAREWFNYKAVHVQANLIARLAADLPTEIRADVYSLVNLALADIDRTLILLMNPLQDRLYAESAIHALQAMRERVLTNIGSVDEIKEEALAQWNQHARQDGFAMVARKLYYRALQNNKGSDFKDAWQYCVDIIAMIKSGGSEPIPGLLDATLHLYYHWRVQRSVLFGSGAVIDWESIRIWAISVLQSGEPSAPFYCYLQALALAHLDHWPDANAIFAHIRASDTIPRDVLWTPRDFLLNRGGGRRQVQGTIKRGASRMFLHVENLGCDFHVDRHGYWPEDGEVANAYIRFSFSGATAEQA